MRLDVAIEVPRGSHVKWRADGEVDFVSPVPCPYNYGYAVGTVGGDGDPIDVIVLGPRLERGHTGRHRARAALRFIDAGQSDDKVVCSLAPLTEPQRRGLLAFFGLYVHAKRLLNKVRGRGEPTKLQGWIDLDEVLDMPGGEQRQ